MTQEQHVNLLDEPWIKVMLHNGRTLELSLKETFAQAAEIKQLVGDVPTQAFALLRLLLAVLYRSVDHQRGDGSWIRRWEKWWRNGLPLEDITAYLECHRDRFDLLDKQRPFYQVADLRTTKNEFKEVSLLILDVPANNRLFSTRAGSGLEKIGFAEAARWLVHAHAFDYSGIKSGAVGDSRVKGGRGYGIGVGWAGNLGGIAVEGRDLGQTLLLNLVKPAPGCGDDLPPWERAPLGAAEEVKGGRQPNGPVDLYTWQSRRIRLISDGNDIVACLVSIGDRLTPQNMHHMEPMTAWRRSKNQEKQLGLPLVYMPREHDPERLFWRGISALLPKQRAVEISDALPTLTPGVIDWLGELDRRYIDPNQLISLHAVGLSYGSNKSVVDEMIDDRLNVSLALLRTENRELAALAESAATMASGTVDALKNLASDLAQASGATTDGPRKRVEEQAYWELDRPYRRWLSELNENTDTDEQLQKWVAQVRSIIWCIASDLLDNVSAKTWRGREKNDWRVNAPLAQMRFTDALRKVLGASPQQRHSDDEKETA